MERAPELVSGHAVCVWIPLFPLRVEETRRPELAGQPVALLAPGNARRLWQASARARRFGVRSGMTVSQAIGLCPALTLCEPDPVLYDEQYSRLLLKLTNVSPVVEPVELGRAFVGVDGLERLYGGPERQLEEIGWAVRTAVGRCGGEAGSGAERSTGATASRRTVIPPYRLGWGRGKFTAWVAAARARPGGAVIVTERERDVFMRNQSVAALPVSPDVQRRCWQLGLKTLGDVLRLPEEALASQFGAEGRRAWRLAAGRITDPVRGRNHPEPITAAMELPAPAAERGMLVHALEQLTARALRHPRRIGWRVHAVRARAELEQGGSWLAEAMLKDPTAERARIVAPLVTRLDQSPPAGAVTSLTVEFTAFVPGTAELQLFARDASSAARAGRRRALRAAAREIKTRFKRPLLQQVVEVQPDSRLPERRYGLIDLEM